MREFIRIIGIGMIGTLAFGARAEYTLNINRGKYPDGVRVENLNGNVPVESWYKNGWTKQGWTGDEYGDVRNAALSPSHMAEETVCESALTLPAMTIETGEWLSWEGCEVYPLFSDTYTVEIKPTDEDTWTTLGKFTESKSIWSIHMIDLDPYAGKEAEVRFVCRSTDGYMLALNNITIKKPTEYTFSMTNSTPKFFGLGELEDGCARIEISTLNTGKSLSGATVVVTADGQTVSTLKEEELWPTGETRFFSLGLPLALNERTDYAITIEADGVEPQTLGESFAYLTSFKRHLYVDKGTGMWCNSCPNGTLAIEELEETYGESLIAADTHNGDPLANDIDFTWLKYHSIPQLTLNHVQATKGETTAKFENQICVPTELEISVTGMNVSNDGSLTVKATVTTSESFTATDRKYRIGYALTRNVSGNEDMSYYQKNICTLGKQKQYRYLPSTMIYQMCYFPDVTIPLRDANTSENPTFTGIEGSLPESLSSDSTYEYEWTIPMPEGYDSFEGMRLVALIIDGGSRNIINSTAAYVDELAGVEEIGREVLGSEAIFTLDGRRVDRNEMLEPGIYIINGKKRMVR